MGSPLVSKPDRLPRRRQMPQSSQSVPTYFSRVVVQAVGGSNLLAHPRGNPYVPSCKEPEVIEGRVPSGYQVWSATQLCGEGDFVAPHLVSRGFPDGLEGI
jgi:hypothetical protein